MKQFGIFRLNEDDQSTAEGGSKLDNDTLSKSSRRRSFALGFSLGLASFLSACGKSVFGGEARKVKPNPEGSVAADASAGNSDANGGGNGGGSGGGTGGPATDGGGGGGGGTDPKDPDRKYSTESAAGPCDGVALSTVDVSKVESDNSILASDPATRFKFWGREESALLALQLGSSVTVGSTIILLNPTSSIQGMSDVIAMRQILDASVDVSDPTSMVLFDNLNLSGISRLIVAIIEPSESMSKTEITDIQKLLHPQSKRFASQFRGKPVIDLQMSFLPDQEGLGNAISAIADHCPIFGGEGNGFGVARNTDQAFQARSLRTSGYLGAGEAETAHITHSKSNWSFPSKFSAANTIVTDLLEREISDRFSGSTTTVLKDECNFVVYVPSNERYFRFIVTVG